MGGGIAGVAGAGVGDAIVLVVAAGVAVRAALLEPPPHAASISASASASIGAPMFRLYDMVWRHPLLEVEFPSYGGFAATATRRRSGESGDELLSGRVFVAARASQWRQVRV